MISPRTSRPNKRPSSALNEEYDNISHKVIKQRQHNLRNDRNNNKTLLETSSNFSLDMITSESSNSNSSTTNVSHGSDTNHSRSSYHPLRKLISSKKKINMNSPLNNWLLQHNIKPEKFIKFVNSIEGKVVTPFSGDDYNIARKESDNAYNKYPLMVVYCKFTCDVVRSINFARNNNIKVNARAGGHNTCGYSVLDNHMVIDVSSMKGIDINTKEMYGKIGAGVEWGEFNNELSIYGLHCVGGSCPSVGCTGYTLGGGYGYTSMKYGIACDNLLEVTMVTAGGLVVTCNKDENSDLLWASKGGTGGNFGIVCSLKYKLHNLNFVYPIQLNYDIKYAAKVLHTWQNKLTKTLKDTNVGLLGFLATKEHIEIKPNGAKIMRWIPYFAFRGIYSGSAEQGKKTLKPLLDIPHKNTSQYPLFTKKLPYNDLNEHLLDNVEGVIPNTIKETKRCAYVEKQLTLADYQLMVNYYKKTPNLYNIVSMEPYGGAINKVKPNDTAFVHRNAYFDIFVDSFWMPNDNNKKEEKEYNVAKKWLDGYFLNDEMKHLWSENYYQNYPYQDYKNWQRGYFGSNLERLRRIKQKWDPNNFFQFPQSVNK